MLICSVKNRGSHVRWVKVGSSLAVCLVPCVAGSERRKTGKIRSRRWRACERSAEEGQAFGGNVGFCRQIYDDRLPKESFKIRKSEGCCLSTGSKTLN